MMMFRQAASRRTTMIGRRSSSFCLPFVTPHAMYQVAAAYSMERQNFSSSSSKDSSMQAKALDVLLKNAKIETTDKSWGGNSIPKSVENEKQQQNQEAPASSFNTQETPIRVVTDKKPAEANPTTSPSPSSPPPKMASVPPPPHLNAQFLHEFAPKIVVVGIGGAGGNALNNMISKELHGVDFIAMNTDAQHLSATLTDQRIQLGIELTKGLGCGANPDAGRMAAEESREQIKEKLKDAHLVFITAGMGGGTGTGAAPVVAEICYEMGIMTVGVVTLPFSFEGTHRRRLAQEGIERLQSVVDTLIVIPNQNLFQIAGPETTFVEAFQMADDVLLGGVKSITDLMTSPGLINLDFADVQAVMVGMGNALLGTGVCSDEQDRAIKAAELALSNPLLGDNLDIATAKGVLVNITGGKDMKLFEVDKAAQLITSRVMDESANIIFGSAYDPALEGSIRVSIVATGIDVPTF